MIKVFPTEWQIPKQQYGKVVAYRDPFESTIMSYQTILWFTYNKKLAGTMVATSECYDGTLHKTDRGLK